MPTVNIALEIFSIVVCGILALARAPHSADRTRLRVYFIVIASANILVMMTDIAAWIFSGRPGTGGYVLLMLISLLYAVAEALLMLAVSLYVQESLHVRGARIDPLLRKITLWCISIYGLLSIVFLLTGSNPTVERGTNNYKGVGVFPPLLVFVMIVFAANFAMLIYYGSLIRVSEKIFLGSYITFPLIALAMQAYIMDVSWLNIAITLLLLLMFVYVHTEQNVRVAQQNQELANMRIRILLSQIQPHFLFNALTAIRQLCDTDPRQAKQSILEFSRFLRINMEGLTAEQPIPFDRELEHVHNYVALEKQRFGERLNVLYDINKHDFRIPALTLQPIVENAIRHGIMKKEEGGTIRIRTDETKRYIYILVADDGVGFDVAEWEKGLREQKRADRRRELIGELTEQQNDKPQNAASATGLSIPRRGAAEGYEEKAGSAEAGYGERRMQSIAQSLTDRIPIKAVQDALRAGQQGSSGPYAPGTQQGFGAQRSFGMQSGAGALQNTPGTLFPAAQAKQEQKNRTHVGLDNIRQRLKMQMNADIEIESEPGKGTSIRIRLPKEKEPKE